jgi:hypothetical protein
MSFTATTPGRDLPGTPVAPAADDDAAPTRRPRVGGVIGTPVGDWVFLRRRAA